MTKQKQETTKPKEPILGCPACRDNITTQLGILPYKPIYLKKCLYHTEMWKAADKRFPD